MRIITKSNYQLFCQEPRLTPDEQRIEREMQRAITAQMKRRDLSLWQVIVDATRTEQDESLAASRRVTDADDWSDLVASADAHRRLVRARIKVYQRWLALQTRPDYHQLFQEPPLADEEWEAWYQMDHAVKANDDLRRIVEDGTRAEQEAYSAACRRVTDDPADLAAECDAQVRLKRAKIKVYMAMVNAPRCWCGAKMNPLGIGAYPYNCAAKDKHPHDMVYAGCDNGHTGWTHESAVTAAT